MDIYCASRNRSLYWIVLLAKKIPPCQIRWDCGKRRRRPGKSRSQRSNTTSEENDIWERPCAVTLLAKYGLQRHCNRSAGFRRVNPIYQLSLSAVHEQVSNSRKRLLWCRLVNSAVHTYMCVFTEVEIISKTAGQIWKEWAVRGLFSRASMNTLGRPNGVCGRVQSRLSWTATSGWRLSTDCCLISRSMYGERTWSLYAKSRFKK